MLCSFLKELSEWTLLGYFVQLKGHCLLTYQEFLIFHGGRDSVEAKSEMYSYNTGKNTFYNFFHFHQSIKNGKFSTF
jgi:hypothetical protein